MTVTNVLIVGVGGQGTILASRILGEVMLSQNYDVKISEIHGMSQRGGSVVTQLRFGTEVASPIIEPGTVDVLLAFERLEALRYANWLKKSGALIVNDQRIDPMPVVTGSAQYPEEIVEKLSCFGIRVIAADAHALAKEAGNAKSVNVVLLGMLSAELAIPEAAWLDALKKTVAPRFIEANLKAFALGRAQ